MLVSSLIPQNDVEELGKLPELFRHYRFHAQPAQGGLSVGQFLAQHYGAGAASGTDSWCVGKVLRAKRPQSAHDGLPLQGQHNIPPLVYLVPAVGLVLVPSRPFRGSKTRSRLDRLPYAGTYQAALLQPPQA